MAEDRSNRTEPATPKRKEEARKKGQIAVSRDLSTAVILLSGIGLLAAMLPVGVQKMTEMTRQGLALSFPLDFHGGMSIEQVYSVVIHAGIAVVTLSLPIVMGILVMGSAASLLQTGLLWRAEAVQPDVARISPIKGLSRLFSMRSVMELVKGLLKIAVVTAVGLWAVRNDVFQIPGLIEFDIGTVLQVTGGLSLKVSLAVAGAIAVLAGLDYFYQRYEWERSLRMSKEEIKEEHKASEGDPFIKSRVRTIQREMTKKRMMAAVKTADVVITNRHTWPLR